MKPIEEQDHYEVLELPYGARSEDIRRAYPIVRGAYEEESLATYSVFRPDEVELIRERIDVAYRVLTDDDARRRYDEQIGVDPDLQQIGGAAVAVDNEPSESAVEIVATLEALDELDELDDEEGLDWDGARLRRARMRRGVEIDQIAEITKINPMYLRALEASAYRDLPAAVYTRGFVTAYSRTIGLDPQPVARSFMVKFEDARSDQRRSGLLAGRR
jgi:curved DNA-binding protein CbpA